MKRSESGVSACLQEVLVWLGYYIKVFPTKKNRIQPVSMGNKVELYDMDVVYIVQKYQSYTYIIIYAASRSSRPT